MYSDHFFSCRQIFPSNGAKSDEIKRKIPQRAPRRICGESYWDPTVLPIQGWNHKVWRNGNMVKWGFSEDLLSILDASLFHRKCDSKFYRPFNQCKGFCQTSHRTERTDFAGRPRWQFGTSCLLGNASLTLQYDIFVRIIIFLKITSVFWRKASKQRQN